MAVTIPIYFQKTQFTARLGETERKQAADFFETYYQNKPLPESSRHFLGAIFQLVSELNANPAPVTQKPIENEAHAALALAEAENRKLKAELEIEKANTKGLTAEIDFTIFEDPRLKGLNDFRLPEHTHPFETIQRFKQLADESIIQYEQLKFTLEQQPFQLLEPEEYEWLKKWDEEVFMPAMRQLTGRPELVLTARHKYMMVLDYAQADPIAEIARLIPGLTPAQLDILQDLQFPRASIVQQVLHDIDEPKTKPDDTTTVVAAPQQETEARIIAIDSANGRTSESAIDTTDGQNTDKPE